MKFFFKYIVVFFVSTVSLYSAPARGGVITFVQPDGTEFRGLLKGDSSFHWIESNGQIVKLNPKNHFFYKADVTAGKLSLTQEKPVTLQEMKQHLQQSASFNTVEAKHDVNATSKKALSKLYRASKKGHGPR